MRLKHLFLIIMGLTLFLISHPGFGAEGDAEEDSAAILTDEDTVGEAQPAPDAEASTDDYAALEGYLTEGGGNNIPQIGDLPGEEGTTTEEEAPPLTEFEMMQKALADARIGTTQEEFFHGCQYVTSQTLMMVLSAFISPKGEIAESAEADMVIISEVPENIEKLKRIIAEVDRPTPQVLVRAHIIEISRDYQFEKELSHLFEALGGTGSTFLKQASVNLAAPETFAGEFLTRYGGFMNIQPLIQNYGGDRTNQLNSVLRYLEANGVAKLLASPNLILRRNVQGEVHVGDQVPYEVTFLDEEGRRVISTEYKNVGVFLTVVPLKIFGDTVRLFIKPEVSTFVDVTANGQPLFNVRTATTQLDVKDGELLSIGGLYKKDERETIRKVPILGDLPLLGHFFTSVIKTSTESQLIFLFTTEILQPSKKNEVNIYRPDVIPESMTEEIARQKEVMDITFSKDKEKEDSRQHISMAGGGQGLSIHHPRAIPDAIDESSSDQPLLELESNKLPIQTFENYTNEVVAPIEYNTNRMEEAEEEITLPLPETTPEQEVELLPEDSVAPEADPEPVPEAEVILIPERPLSMQRSYQDDTLPVEEAREIDLISDLEQSEFAAEENNHFYADLPEVFQ